jgi:hypothetical protein
MAGVMFTPSTYGSGEQTLEDMGYTDPTWYPNLAPDPGAEEVYAVPSAIGDFSLYSDQYRIASTALGAGGAVACALDATLVHSGAQSLRLSTSSAGAPTNTISALGPNFDVEEGQYYLASCWAAKTTSGALSIYVRLVGGSDDALTEYPGHNNATMLPTNTAFQFENKNLAAASTWYQVFLIVGPIPAGVTRAAFRVFDNLPSTGSTVCFDDFSVTKIDNSPYCDTGWIPLPLSNGWVDYVTSGTYPPASFRKVGGIVYVRGLLKNGTIANQTVMGTLPVGFRPPFDHMNATVCSPGGATARIDVQLTGNVSGMYGLVAQWTSITVAPFPADA